MARRYKSRRVHFRRLSFEQFESRLALAAVNIVSESFDGSASPPYAINGSAELLDGRLRLTNDYLQAGSLWFDSLLVSNRFAARFDFEFADQGGIHWGDGFTFAVLDAEVDDGSAIGDKGGHLGYTGLSGFAIEVDTYPFNFEDNTSLVHVGLDVGGDVTSIATSDNLPFEIRGSGVLTAEVVYDEGLVTVALAKPGFPSTRVLTATVPEMHRPKTGRIGFTAATADAHQDLFIDNLTVTQVLPLTVITHGFQLSATFPAWAYDMATAINFRAGFPCSTLDHDDDKIPDSIQNAQFNSDGPVVTVDNSESCGHFVIWDWAKESRNPGTADDPDVAGALADRVVAVLDAFDSIGLRPDLHFIGHSRGTYVNAEAIRQLAETDMASVLRHVQMTTLDPQSFWIDPLNTDGQLEANPGGIVDWSDNYYQTAGGAAPDEGKAIPGAINIDLTDIVVAWAGRNNAGEHDSGNHSEVHDWYHWTVDIAPRFRPGPIIEVDSAEGEHTSDSRSTPTYVDVAPLQSRPVLYPEPVWDNGRRVGYFWSVIGGGVSGTQGLDRWYATVGGDDSIPVVWTVNVAKPGDYELNITVDGLLSSWKLAGNSQVVVDGKEPILFGLLGSLTGIVSLGHLNAGVHKIRIESFDVPSTAVIEGITFQLSGPAEHQLEALFVADRPELSLTAWDVVINGQSISLNGVDELIQLFRPILHFDQRERYRAPFAVEDTFPTTVPDIRGESGPVVALDLSTWANKTEADMLRLPSVYASIVEHESGGELAINYYFHYPYSNWLEYGGANSHEGDWEGATVFLRKENNYWSPDTVALAQHVEFINNIADSAFTDGGDRFWWQQLQREGSRPHLYVGLGGHATYGAPGQTDWPVLCFPSEVQEYHPADFGFSVDAGRAVYLDRVGDGSSHEWLLYPGRWGVTAESALCAGSTSPPRGPVFLDTTFSIGNAAGQRWLDPWAWSNGFNYEPWQNKVDPADVDTDGQVALFDLLLVVAGLRENGNPYDLPLARQSQENPIFPDVNGDNVGSIFDALLIVEQFRSRFLSAEGEEAVPVPGLDSQGEGEMDSEGKVIFLPLNADHAWLTSFPLAPTLSQVEAGFVDDDDLLFKSVVANDTVQRESLFAIREHYSHSPSARAIFDAALAQWLNESSSLGTLLLEW